MSEHNPVQINCSHVWSKLESNIRPLYVLRSYNRHQIVILYYLEFYWSTICCILQCVQCNTNMSNEIIMSLSDVRHVSDDGWFVHIKHIDSFRQLDSTDTFQCYNLVLNNILTQLYSFNNSWMISRQYRNSKIQREICFKKLKRTR